MPLPARHAALAAVALACAVTVPAAPALAAGPGPDVTRVNGPTAIYDSAYRNVRTTVYTGRIRGGSWVVLAATGFPRSAAGRTFGVHVHKNACGPRPEDSGPHYRSPRVPKSAPLVRREVWLDLKIGRRGAARSVAVRPWLIPKGTRSVVIHLRPTNPRTGDAGDRILCTTVPFGGARH